ncbi:MAG: ATP-binding protein [Clostridia bacterium]|nr:ATP-binding protein [Clostridia bacterium]
MKIEVKNFKGLEETKGQLCAFLAESRVSEEHAFNCKLVVSELVGNVLRHSDGTAFVEWRLNGAFVELVICSSTRYIPPKVSRLSDVYAESGRGLYLVDAVCEERIEVEGGVLVRVRIKD